jgi:hypothetical protein
MHMLQAVTKQDLSLNMYKCADEKKFASLQDAISDFDIEQNPAQEQDADEIGWVSDRYSVLPLYIVSALE